MNGNLLSQMAESSYMGDNVWTSEEYHEKIVFFLMDHRAMKLFIRFFAKIV